MTSPSGRATADPASSGGSHPPIIVATILREHGSTGVHTHVNQLRQYLKTLGTETPVITPFSWGRALTYPVFGARLPLHRVSPPASVAWYRHWHEVFLLKALRRELARYGDVVLYTQGPEAASAALRARLGPHQRVVMAVHYETSHANEWAAKGYIQRGGAVFRAIRRLERDVIPQLDGLVYVSESAREEVLGWLPEAAAVPSSVIPNFIAPVEPIAGEPMGDLVTVGALEVAKNHRYLVRILAEAKRMGYPLTLDVYGIGPLRRDLEQLAESEQVRDQIRFRGFRPDVRRYLPRYRAYVHASYVESQSIAIMEAMAAGLPIVAAKIGGISEICDDGVEARFWPLDEPRRAAEILVALLESDAAVTAASVASTRRFHRDFDASVVAPRLHSFLLAAASREPMDERAEQLSA